jgi:hypothetical protein
VCICIIPSVLYLCLSLLVVVPCSCTVRVSAVCLLRNLTRASPQLVPGYPAFSF